VFVNDKEASLQISQYKGGLYFVVADIGGQLYYRKAFG
jgi:hypothetical protein